MSHDMFSIITGGSGLADGSGLGKSTSKAGPEGAFALALAQAEAVGAPRAGQDFAVGPDGRALPVVASAQWAAVTVSPAMRVITDGQMDVGQDALLAFAQQQGLSPGAIQALRLQLQGAELTSPMASAPSSAAPTLVTGAAALAGLGARGSGVPGLALSQVPADGVMAQGASTPGAAVQGGVSRELLSQGAVVSVGAAQGVAAQGAMIQGGLTQAVVSQGVATHGAFIQADAAAGAMAQGAVSEGAASALLRPLGASSNAVAQADADPAASLAQTLVPTTGVLAQALRGGRDGLLPSERAIGGPQVMSEQALAQAPQLGVGVLPLKTVFKLAVGQQLPKPAAANASGAQDALVLDDVVSGDVLDLLAQAPSLSRHTGAAMVSSASTAGAQAAPAPSSAGLPAASDVQAKYDAVAQKLGEAIGQRLHAQIQRGEWQLSLRLHPQELGAVDVQLGMRGGDLVASFHASQQMTRDMLQDQMPRLREMLNGAGIDVASAGVGSQSGERSGGNPTPSRQDAQASVTGSVGRAPTAAGVPNGSAGSGQVGNDGLDLWA